MSQAGSKPLKESSSVNDGIIDLSDEKTVEEYINAQTLFIDEVLNNVKEGKVRYGVVPYKVSGFIGGVFDPAESETSQG